MSNRLTRTSAGVPPVFEARVQGNNVSNMAATALDGIQATLGALSTDNATMCFNISGNTISAPRNSIRIRTGGLPSATPDLKLHNWDGTTSVAAYLQNLNPAATSTTANINGDL